MTNLTKTATETETALSAIGAISASWSMYGNSERIGHFFPSTELTDDAVATALTGVDVKSFHLDWGRGAYGGQELAVVIDR